MKKILLIGLWILSNSLFGQIPGKTIEGPINLFDSIIVKKGDILYLGKGSDPETGNFVHIYAPKNKTIPIAMDIISGFFTSTGFDSKAIPQINLDKGFAGKQLVVESFSEITSKKNGNKIIGVIDMSGHSIDEQTSASGTLEKNEDKTVRFIEISPSNSIPVEIESTIVIVDFEPAFKSGEIIKISAPESTAKAPAVQSLFLPFEMTVKGIEPVVVAIYKFSRDELYNKVINWTHLYYKTPNQATINTVPDQKININNVAKNVRFGSFNGRDLFADLPYLFTVDFTDNEIRMPFTLGDENGDITDEYGEVIANVSPSHIFNKKGEVSKRSEIFKAEAERIMNDLSYAMVDYLMK